MTFDPLFCIKRRRLSGILGLVALAKESTQGIIGGEPPTVTRSPNLRACHCGSCSCTSATGQASYWIHTTISNLSMGSTPEESSVSVS